LLGLQRNEIRRASSHGGDFDDEELLAEDLNLEPSG
jgi:hypothetical protein